MPRGQYVRTAAHRKAAQKRAKKTREAATTGDNLPVAPQETIAARIGLLNDRERALAIRARMRKRVTVLVSVDEYEHILDLAERHNEEISVVTRAALRYGLRHYDQFATPTVGFAEGAAAPRRPGDLDPSGLAAYPPPLQARPNPAGAPLYYNVQPPAPFQGPIGVPAPFSREEQSTETVWGPPVAVPPGILPSGATPLVEPTPPPAVAAPSTVYAPPSTFAPAAPGDVLEYAVESTPAEPEAEPKVEPDADVWRDDVMVEIDDSPADDDFDPDDDPDFQPPANEHPTYA